MIVEGAAISTSSVLSWEEWAMLAAPPTSMIWRRSSGRTRRVVAEKHSKRASHGGAAMVVLDFGISRVGDEWVWQRDCCTNVRIMALMFCTLPDLQNWSIWVAAEEVWGTLDVDCKIRLASSDWLYGLVTYVCGEICKL